jgi:hypothetical protein
MMPLIQFERLREDQAKESRGQKEDLHATLAKMQQKRDEKESLLQCCIEGKEILMKGYER